VDKWRLRCHEDDELRTIVGDIVYDDDTVGAAVVRGGDRAEAFLAGGVPLEAQ
jgi:hypothetical protein